MCENVFLKIEGIAHIMGTVLEVPGGRMAKKPARFQEIVSQAGKPLRPVSTDVKMGLLHHVHLRFSLSIHLPDELRQETEQGDQESNHILLPHFRPQDPTRFSARREEKCLSLIEFDIWIITLDQTF